MIKTIIADDEIAGLDRIKKLLNEYADFTIIETASDGNDLLQKIFLHDPDLVILDIEMPGVNVFETLNGLKNPPLVIFQTAYREYAPDAFRVEAVDYLMKPISKELFEQALNKVRNRHFEEPPASSGLTKPSSVTETNLENISVKDGKSIKIIPVKSIIYIAFEDGLTFIYTSEGRSISDESITHYEALLSQNAFYRIDRSYLINIVYITKLEPFFQGVYIVHLTNGEKLKISRRRVKGLKELLHC